LVTGPIRPLKMAGNDPTIAASDTHLVLTTNGEIRFYTKSGNLVTTDKNGNAIVNPITPWQLFSPFWNPSDPDNIDAHLNLPPEAPCDPTIFPFGNLTQAQKDATKFCLNNVYDTRVIFDDFRKRFWLVAAARNPAWKTASLPEQRAARRSKLLLAVSLTQDPRDGWYLYGWDSVLDDGACTNIGFWPGPAPKCPGTEYIPGDASDYPSIGISKDYFVWTIYVNNVNPWAPNFPKTTCCSYTNIFAVDSDGLANGGCLATCGWSYGVVQLDLTGLGQWLAPVYDQTTQPAVHHDAEPSGYTLLAAHHPDLEAVVVLGFRKAEGAVGPPLHAALVPVGATKNPNDMLQMPQGAVTSPARIRITNLGQMALKAVAREQLLWLTWQDCKTWTGSNLGECASSIRLAELFGGSALNGFAAPLYFDGAIGNKAAYAGNPAVETNADFNSIVVYTRSGPTVVEAARYAAAIFGEPQLRNAATIELGNFPLGNNGSGASTGNLDTGGAAVDPKDGLGIWLFHGISLEKDDTGVWRFAFGKVFGKPYPDLTAWGGKLIEIFPAAPSAGGSVRISAQVSNEGDGRAGAVEAIASLVAGGESIELARFPVPALPSGETTRLTVDTRIPKSVEPGRHRLRIGVDPSGDEYGEANNTAERELVIENKR
jgi:CARDB